VAVEMAAEEEEPPEKSQNTWDWMRSLSQMEKILLAVKADRTERALLLQDNDPRVLLSMSSGFVELRRRKRRLFVVGDRVCDEVPAMRAATDRATPPRDAAGG